MVGTDVDLQASPDYFTLVLDNVKIGLIFAVDAIGYESAN